MDKIGIIAWGSLWWDPRDLNIRRAGFMGSTWRKDGPHLALEFSRVSRDQRLTLVIDEVHGVDCPTLVAKSGLSNLNDAIRNLMAREGTQRDTTIGYINFRDGRERDPSEGASPRAMEAIREWGAKNGYDAVIWTGLRSNFREKKHVEFSVDGAILHLKSLPTDERETALAYFKKAPPQIRTPLREQVERRF